jgi:hypothetical protein
MRVKSCLDAKSSLEIRSLLELFWLRKVNYWPSGYHGPNNSHSLDGLLVYLDAQQNLDGKRPIEEQMDQLKEQMDQLIQPFYDSPYYYAAAKWGLSSDESCTLFQKQIPLTLLFKRAESIIQKHGFTFPPFGALKLPVPKPVPRIRSF